METTREFPLAVVLSMSTGVLFCEFSAMHEAAEFLTSGPIWTHEFGRRELWELFRADIHRQHPALASVDASHVNKDNWQAWLAEQMRSYPATVALTPIPDYGRTKGPIRVLDEWLEDHRPEPAPFIIRRANVRPTEAR